MGSSSKTSVRIYFDNPSGRYTPGDHLTGKIVLLLPKERYIEGIDMVLIGKTKTSCSSVEQHLHHRGHSRRSADTEKYMVLNLRQCLTVNGDPAGRRHNLAKGTYEYRFLWLLPPDIPASFEGPYGWVRYRMEVIIKASFWDHRCDAEAEFYVTGHYDLNTLDRGLREVEVQNKWTYHFDEHYGATYLELHLELERRAYVPGETIKFAVTTNLRNNKGHPPISGAVVSFVQEQTYKIKDKIRRNTQLIHRHIGPMIFPNGIEVWNGSMYIVPLPPTLLGSGVRGRLIDVQYFLKVILDKEPHEGGILSSERIECIVNLQIGTIPFVRRGRRNVSTSSAPPSRELSIELPTNASPSHSARSSLMSPYNPDPNVSMPQSGPIPNNGGSSIQPMMDFLAVQPGSSRRSSAPPLWLEALQSDVVNGPAEEEVYPEYSSSAVTDSPPPSYEDAVCLGSAGCLAPYSLMAGAGSNREMGEGDPPEYQRQPPFFLRKGARHLFDSCNSYATL